MSTIPENDHLSSVLFGKTRRAILSLLHGHTDEAFYLRQIAKATRAGLGAVQRELNQLTGAGIISRTIKGRQVYYQANEKCPIFNELKSIVRKTFGLADVLRQSLTPKADEVRLAFIFGSVARSTDDRRSDIDLIVVGRISFGDVVSLLSPAEEILGREVNAVVYPVAEFRKKAEEDHHFVKTVLEGEKIFLIGDEKELRRLVK